VTTGGAICGYCEIGNAGITTKPAIKMRIEATVARTGRLRNAFVTSGLPT